MLIENDVFDIASRLKEIDATYDVRYNKITKKFELHGGKPYGLILVFPYERLDQRALVHARKTRIERLAQIIEEIDMNNAKIERDATSEAKEKICEFLEESIERERIEKR